MSTIRLVHLSDIHVTTSPVAWKLEDWFSKRLGAWMNLRLLGRGYRFRNNEHVLCALAAELKHKLPDRVIFSGDATALGFRAEIERAATLLGVNSENSLAGLAVPGNHDYCTFSAEASGDFERCFDSWQQGERVDGQRYPFAQRVGSVWLVAVNSSMANRWPWDASGRVGSSQLKRLEQLLARLDGGPRILVTHYPVCLANGKRERKLHGLRDLDDLLAVAERHRVALWLHGHRHHWYYHTRLPSVSFPVICSGSATQHGLWSYGEYVIADRTLHATRRIFDPEENQFRDGDSFELELRDGV